MKFWRKLLSFWRCWKTQFFWVGHFDFFFSKKKKKIDFISMKISHKLYIRMDGTQFLILWWFTAKNESGNDKIAWVYISLSSTTEWSTLFISPTLLWPCKMMPRSRYSRVSIKRHCWDLLKNIRWKKRKCMRDFLYIRWKENRRKNVDCNIYKISA